MRGARPLRSTRRLQNLHTAPAPWWKIQNRKAEGLPAMVSIYDEIGMFGLSAGEFLAELAGVDGDLDVHINCPGGDVFDAIAIYNSLRNRRGTVAVTIDGLAASAASFIAQAASPGKLEMAPFSTMMIHDGFAAGIGNAADMRDLADQLDAASDNIAAIYADRSGKAASYWRAKMRATTWYKDSEAVSDGLADRVRGETGARNAWDLSVFDVRPSGKKAGKKSGKPMNDDDEHDDDEYEGKGKPIGDGWVMDPNGTCRFDPDGDGDDDSTPEGDTDHDYFDENGKQIKPIPPKPDVPKDSARGSRGASGRKCKPRNTDGVDESPWDASKAWAAGAASDDPAAFYKGICAGKKDGDPSTQGAWALPYRYTPGGPVNAAGVRNALARLSQTQGLTNAEQAKATLEKAMRKVNPDWEPGNSIDPTLLAALFVAGFGKALEGSDK